MSTPLPAPERRRHCHHRPSFLLFLLLLLLTSLLFYKHSKRRHSTHRSSTFHPMASPTTALLSRTSHLHLPPSLSRRPPLLPPSSTSHSRRPLSASLSSPSPFTEKDSPSRYQRDRWAFPQGFAAPLPPSDRDREKERERDIALQLPELKKLLEVLMEKRMRKAGGGGGDGGGVPGSVALVGTGPGDPELLTVKAVRAIAGADLVLYDRLVSNDVLDLVGDGARLLYVGKTAGYHSRTQEEIHDLLLNFAEAGANVVRLKGGDPLVFGRGGEEMDFLQQKGIKVKVIPGITSASGIAADLGIPLTHRGISNSVRFSTGHSRNGGTEPSYIAENAADPDSTLVIYMGLSTLPSLASLLMHRGLPADTPAAAVERGTTPQQRVVFAEIKDLVAEVRSAALVSPTLIIIGKVVALSPLWPRPACVGTLEFHDTPSRQPNSEKS